MTEILSVCIFGTAEAAAQAWFAEGFLGAGEARGRSRLFVRHTGRGLFCAAGGVLVNMLPFCGSIKLLIYSLLMYGFIRIALRGDRRAAAVCTVTAVTVMQGCFGFAGALEGFAVIAALRFGILLRGMWITVLGNVLPLGLFLIIGGRINGAGQDCREFMGVSEKFPGKYEAFSGAWSSFPIACLLPVTMAAVYINSVIYAAADTGRLDILPGAVQLAVIIAVLRLFRIWRSSEMSRVYRGYAEKMNEILKSTEFIRHDLKNHILTIGTLAGRGEYERLRDYAAELAGEAQSLSRICACGSAALDALIDSKLSGVCGIYVRCSVRIPRGAVCDRDLCVIFGNVLDNALKGCGSSGNGFIDIKTVQMGDMLLIECKNYCTSDGFEEGTGLRSVRRTAEKYSGCVTARAEENIFTVRILLNISRRKRDSSRQSY